MMVYHNNDGSSMFIGETPCKCDQFKDQQFADVKSMHISDSFLDPLYYEDKVVMENLPKDDSFEDVTTPYKNSKYGWSFLTNKFLQRFNKPIYFLIVLCLAGIAQGLVVTGVSFTVITSIEKQFGLKSTEVGLFGTIYDIAYGSCCVFVGYIGHKHKPRWLGFGLLLMAIGALIFTIPKYLIGPYIAGVERDSDFCTTGNLFGDTNCQNSSNWYYRGLFYLAELIMGIGATPIYTLGPAHIDEITDRGQGSLYLAVFYAACAFGPGIGFIIGLPILNTWVDVTQPANSSLTPNDRNWVGAWWIGFLVGAILLLIPVIPMLGFPRLFPNNKIVKKNKIDLEDTVEENDRLKHDLGSLWPATKGLLTNPSFLFICLASASESLTIGGFSTFLPKFVETQFHVTSSNAALYTGLIVIPGGAGGIFVGGYLIKRYDWKCKQILKASTVMALIATFCVAISLVGCQGRQVVGAEDELLSRSSLNRSCISDCSCSTKYYKPICSVSDQVTYFSPCHAGCSKNNQYNETYENCSCFPYEDMIAVEGRCTPDCNLFPLFVFGSFMLMFFTFINNVPMLNATFRVVPEGQGSFAMGVQEVFVRFLGFIPAPTLFGSLIDKSCNLWHEDKCTGETTSCLEYDNSNFRYYVFLLSVITKFLSFVFIFMAFRYYKAPQNKHRTSKEPLTNGNLYDASSETSTTPTLV